MGIRFQALAVLAVLLLQSPLGRAAEIIVLAGDSDAADRGAFNRLQGMAALPGTSCKVTSDSWQLRWIGAALPAAVETTRNDHFFGVPALAPDETIVAATLTLPHPSNSYGSPDANETVGLFAIDTSASADLRDNAFASITSVSECPDFFSDLGDGAPYATFQATVAQNGTAQDVPLNAGALSALNALARGGGGEWGLGAAILSGNHPEAGAQERVFRGTGGSFTTPSTLTLTTSVVVATPALSLAAQALLGLALLGCGALWARPFRRPARMRAA